MVTRNLILKKIKMSAPKIIIKILDYCNRGCLHCCIDAKPKGKTMSEDDFFYVLETLEHSPKLPQGRIIGLTGGDVLQHPDLGHVLDLFLQRSLRVNLGTRGFTSHERRIDALPYRNFRALIDRMNQRYPQLKNPLDVSLSFDVYGFKGNKEKSLDALTSALPELLEYSLSSISIIMTSSPERKDETTEFFIEALRRRGSIGGTFTEYYWRQKWAELNDIVFNSTVENTIGVFPIKKKGGGGVDIRLGKLDFGGRADRLSETHGRKTRCNVLHGREYAFVDINLDVRLCCGAQSDQLALPYSNLRDNPLAIYPREPDRDYLKYVEALRVMEKKFHSKRHLESICSYCAKTMPGLLGIKA